MRKLEDAVALTDEVRAAIEKFLTKRVGPPHGCSANPYTKSPDYPDREAVKAAVEKVWHGLRELYQLDAVACQVDWYSTTPFISNEDSRWLYGGAIAPWVNYRQP